MTCPTCGQPCTPAHLTFGTRVRLAREQRGWTQREAAEAGGIPQTTWSSWERFAGWPDEDACRRIAAALEVPVGYLVGMVELPPPAGEPGEEAP